MGLNEYQVETLIKNINIHCFKHGLKGEQFLDIVNNFCALLDNLEMSLDELPNHIIQQELDLEKVEGETKDAKVKQLQVLQHYKVNMNDLDEYRRNKPLVETIKSQQNKLEKAKIDRLFGKGTFKRAA